VLETAREITGARSACSIATAASSSASSCGIDEDTHRSIGAAARARHPSAC
jgi:hypothetical protein